ncbi:MAG: hypothetical protein IKL87_02870 [Oscillospiraceae bacterium]|nr:hypothetical protein [Oscillospiraceae bacterium]
MQKYVITYVKKLDINLYSDEMPVGEIEAELLGMAKRTASEYLNQWLIDKKLKIRSKTEWVKDMKRGGQVREFMVSENEKPAKLLFILREA